MLKCRNDEMNNCMNAKMLKRGSDKDANECFNGKKLLY